MRTKIERFCVPAGHRLIAISDIHGNLDYLQGLLEKISYSTEDILVLVGDVLEKGHQNLETLRFLTRLSKDHKIYKAAGNCDILYEDVFEGFTRENGETLLKYMLRCCRRGADTGVLNQMSDEMGFPISETMDLERWREELWAHFQEELEFLRGWPIILETDKVVFVHAGLAQGSLEEQNAWKCRKWDDFMRQEQSFSKLVVVGHWPTSNYPAGGVHDCGIRLDRERNICSIDGGCVVKETGQLNALILPDGDPDRMYSVGYDGFPVAEALEDQEGTKEPHSILWGAGRQWVDVLEEQEGFAHCRQTLTGQEYWILSEDLYVSEKDGHMSAAVATDYCPEIHKGDRVSLMKKTSRGYYIKKDGIIGWYGGKLSY